MSNKTELLKLFKENSKESSSLYKFFTGLVGPSINSSSYFIKKEIDGVFLRGGANKSRSVLAEHETVVDDSSKKNLEEDSVINLINEYIRRLDLRSTESILRLKTLFIVFLRRELRDRYSDITVNPSYANLLSMSYYKINNAKLVIIQDMKSDLLNLDQKSPSQYPDDIKLDIILDYLKRDEIEDELDYSDVEIQANSMEELLDSRAYQLITSRLDRSITPKTFPYLTSEQLEKARLIVTYYKKMYKSYAIPTHLSILTSLMKISASSYNKYKSLVGSELLKLSTDYSSISILNYLTDSNEEE